MAIPPEDREIRVDAGLWQLEANPGRIEAAAAAWRRLAKAGTTIGDDIDGDTKKIGRAHV